LNAADGSEGLHAETLRKVERIPLPLVLAHAQGNQRQAAKILGIARQSLRCKLRELGVTVQSSIDLAEGE
jgi:DNA-binding protein Fis